MRILIVSDTHRKEGNLRYLLDKMKPLDMLIHCGDAENDPDHIRQVAECPIHMVAGNCDFLSGLPVEEKFMIGGYRVWLTHGHRQFVGINNRMLLEEAKRRECQIVMFGHTHKPFLEIARTADGITAINPGSLSAPRQEGYRPTYILMELDRQGIAHYHLNYL